MGRIIGIDYGKVDVGIAIADQLQIIATPLVTLRINRNNNLLLDYLKTMDGKDRIEMVVIGLPLSLDGSDSQLTNNVKSIAARIEKELAVKTRLIDERLTSRQAEKLIIETMPKYGSVNKLIDAQAAAIILQTYLDGRKHER